MRQHNEGLFNALKPGEPRSIKYFLISEPGIWGIGNGCLQDILFRARIHPRCPAVGLTSSQRRALFTAITQTIRGAVRLRGRTDEYDLFGERGAYERTLSAATAGKPCPRCTEESIRKESFLGGATYYCPRCQEPPAKARRENVKPK
jgi:formamidopyrimidine-DNA glycosylase